MGLVSALQQLHSKPEQPELSLQGSARSSLALLHTPGAAGFSQSTEPFNGARTPEQEGEAFPPQHPLECETEAAGMARIWPCCIWQLRFKLKWKTWADFYKDQVQLHIPALLPMSKSLCGLLCHLHLQPWVVPISKLLLAENPDEIF